MRDDLVMKPPTLTDVARDYVEKSIFKGELQPGDQIKEGKIAAALDISRPPIREAFKLLEAEGLIARRPRRGVFVAETTHQDVWEIYTLKAELYTFSINLSFHQLTAEDISRMGAVVAEMVNCAAADQPDVFLYQELNTRFHDVHMKAAGHQRLKQIVQMMHNQIRHFSFSNLSNKTYLQKSLAYHRRIFEAFHKGDLESAVKYSREHVLVGLQKINNASADEQDRKIA
jgi:DNA-binding GntR family transcriptional regulator